MSDEHDEATEETTAPSTNHTESIACEIPYKPGETVTLQITINLQAKPSGQLLASVLAVEPGPHEDKPPGNRAYQRPKK